MNPRYAINVLGDFKSPLLIRLSTAPNTTLITYTLGSFILELPASKTGDTVAIYNLSVAGVRLLVISLNYCPTGLNQSILVV